MAELTLLRVFCDEAGEYGNELGVFLNGWEVPEGERQRVAADLGYSETVFVDDSERAAIRIYTPEIELPFAGHPCVGAAWLLERATRRRGHAEPSALRPPAGELPLRFDHDGDRVIPWVTADPAGSPPFEVREHESVEEVDALDPAAEAERGGWTYAWAWQDREAGIVRTRSFVSEAGILEDEATGSAAILLAAQLGRELTVHQGEGSVIRTRPAEGSLIEFGGFVVQDRVSDYVL